MGAKRDHHKQHQPRSGLDRSWKEGLGKCQGERRVSHRACGGCVLGQILTAVHRYQKLVPTGTFAEPEEVAHAVSMLVQDLACNINGADIRIDGGFTIR